MCICQLVTEKSAYEIFADEVLMNLPFARLRAFSGFWVYRAILILEKF